MDDEFNDSDTLPAGATPLWAWRNQGSATVSMSNSRVNLNSTEGGAGYVSRILEQNCPSAPWEFTMKLGLEFPQFATLGVFGIIVLESSTAKYINFAIQTLTSPTFVFTRYQMTNATTYNSQQDFTSGPRPLPLYLRVRDDNTNFIFSASSDGSYFETINTVGRTAFLTGSADKVGFGITYNPGSSINLNSDWFRRTL